jgi:hypothetical protein
MSLFQYLRNNNLFILIPCQYSHLSPSVLTSKHKLNTYNSSELHKNSIQKSPRFLPPLSKNYEIRTNVYFTFYKRARNISEGFKLLMGINLGITLLRSQRSTLARSGVLILKNDINLILTTATAWDEFKTKTKAVITQNTVKPMWLSCTNSVRNYVAGLH